MQSMRLIKSQTCEHNLNVYVIYHYDISGYYLIINVFIHEYITE